MTREEAIKIINCYDIGFYDLSGEKITADKLAEAFDVAIEALEGVCFDEWCTDCKEYDTEKKCCPRFNKVIREALKREPSEDGTLEVKVEDATKVGRVLISDDKHRGGLYYPDEDEPQGISFENDTKIKSCSKDSDLISRAEAIEALGEEPPVWCDEEYEIAERSQWREDVEAIESVPSADRQMVIKCKPFLSEEDFKAFAEQVSDQNVILIPYEAEVVSTNTSTNTSTKSTNISTDTSADRPRDGDLISRQAAIDALYDKGSSMTAWGELLAMKWSDIQKCIEQLPSADRPRGEWVEQEDDYHHYWECSECGMGVGLDDIRNFCPNCGADMRGDTE